MECSLFQVLVFSAVLWVVFAAIHLCEEGVDGLSLVIIAHLLSKDGISFEVCIDQVVLVKTLLCITVFNATHTRCHHDHLFLLIS